MSEEKQMVGCPKCGTENIIDSNNKYCKECGKDLSKYIYTPEVKKSTANKSKKLSIGHYIGNGVVLLIVAGLLAGSIFVQNMIMNADSLSPYSSKGNESVFQQLYTAIEQVHFIDIFLGVIILMLFVAMIILSIWQALKLAKIQKQTSEMRIIISELKENLVRGENK